MLSHGRFAVFVFALGLIMPSQSEAKLILITRGDTISEVGKITGPRIQDLPVATSIAYKYSYFGIFWLDLWRYDGTFCIPIADRTIVPISKTQAAQFLGKQEADLSEPFWYHFPPGLVILGGIILIAVPAALMRKAKQHQTDALMKDPRYQQALNIFLEKSQATQPQPSNEPKTPEEEGSANPDLRSEAWSAAIDHLMSSGIEREQAEQNFVKVLAHALRTAEG